MYKTLSPGVIGIRGKSLKEQVILAEQTGFEGLDFQHSGSGEDCGGQGRGSGRGAV